jgi:peptide/nickel transport system substrate-binding protein
MKRMGAAGAAIGTVSLAGCSGQQNGGDGDGDGEGGGGGGGGGGTATSTKQVEEDLPEERMIGELVHLSNTERYWPERYQANVLIDRWLNDEIGVNAKTTPLEISTMASRYQEGGGDFWTHNWCASRGDPDSIIYNRFHADGTLNYNGFDHGPYNEVAASQRTETDQDARQSQVHEAQKILGEQRPESQYLHNEYPYAVNTNSINPDSVILTSAGPANVHNWANMEPASDAGNVAVTNNWDPSDSMNPLHVNTVGPSRNWTPMTMMHDFLVRPNPNLKPEAWAAEGWEWTDDTTVVVTLKQGMTFHDGEDVTVDDIIYTADLLFETEPPAYTSIFTEVLEGVEQSGDWEITFNLAEPYAPFIAVTLGQLPILPQHYWEQIIEETGSGSQPWSISFNDDRPIVGSGPFKWGTWDQGTKFEMPAFKEHSFSAPNINKRIQRPLSTRDAELEAIKNGDYDILDYWFGDPSVLEEEATNADNLALMTQADDCRQRIQKNCAKPPNDDPAFRQAINAVVMAAQPTIIEEIYAGFGQKAISPVSPLLKFWHNPDTPFFQGVDTAVSILSDAGYAWDSDDNLYYPEGKTGG